jgi:hypothetical protein
LLEVAPTRLGGHLRGDAMLQKRQQLLHYPGGDPGFTVAEIGHMASPLRCPPRGQLAI